MRTNTPHTIDTLTALTRETERHRQDALARVAALWWIGGVIVGYTMFSYIHHCPLTPNNGSAYARSE